jgi:hypothetical protein
MDALDAPADIDRLVDPPALIDVAHQVDVRADGFAHAPDALDFTLRRGVPRQGELRLHLPEALFDQPRSCFHDMLQRKGAHQRAAGVGGYTLAVAAQHLPQRQVEGFAADVP